MRVAAAAFAVAGLAFPAPAFAHDAIGGAGPFFSGVAHPLIVGQHAMTLVALGLWLGRCDLAVVRRGAIVFAIFLAAGLGASPLGSPPAPILAVTALLTGGLAAWARAAPSWCVLLVAGAAALLIGLDSGAADPVALTGTWVGAHLIALNAVYLAMHFDRPWLVIAMRIVGAWIAAIAVLMLALAVRG